MKTHPNTSICKICNITFHNNYAIAKHLSRNHEINSKDYYDKYIQKTDTICHHPNCSKQTEFIGLVKEYRTYCSYVCCANHKNLSEQKTAAKANTLKNHPEIMEQLLETRNQTYINYPEKHTNRINSLKNFYKNNPDKKSEQTDKRNKTIKENPSIMKEAGKKIAITKRNKFKELSKPETNIPYYFYIISHEIKPIIKLGISNNPQRRLVTICRDFGPSKILLEIKNVYHNIKPLEDYLHEYFNEYCKVQPSGGGRTEWFDECILEETISLCRQTSMI